MKKFVLFLFVLATICSCGNRQAQEQDTNKSKYGDWEVCDFLNDFDEPTGRKFVRQIVSGDFSNSATASSDLLVVVFIYEDSDGLSGEMRLDEYSNGVQDMKIWDDGSPAKNGTKIIDKPNRKAYYYKERVVGGFQDRDDSKWYSWIQIFQSPSTYDVTLKGDYKTEYRFSINTDKLELALKDAGIVSQESSSNDE